MLLFGVKTAELTKHKKCNECRKPFRDHTHNNRMKYCCHACMSRHQAREYHRAHYSKPLRLGKCKECQAEFKTPYDKKMYCSDVCYGRHKNDERRQIHTVSCKGCNIRFKQARGQQKFCTKKCAARWRRKEWYKVWIGGPVIRNLKCPLCGLTFEAKGLKRVFCQKSHKDRFWSKVTDGYVVAVPNFRAREAA